MAGVQRLIIGDARGLPEVEDASVQLVVTSPPYWQLKDYGRQGQIGFNQDLEAYHHALAEVWQTCWRVLHEGCRMCINIGDQFARKEVYGRYKVVPLHAEIIRRAEEIGFDFMGSVIWQKLTTTNSSGGGALMGSYPFPRNGVVKFDYEHVLLFKKPGTGPKPSSASKEASRIALDEWKSWFDGHWRFPGTRAHAHLAPFPVELPRRLIRMFTFTGERVLDPFVGSGTTLLAADELGRAGIGVDLDPSVEPIIRERLEDLEVLRREAAAPEEVPGDAAFFGSVVRKQDRGRQRHVGAKERLGAVTGPNAFRTRSGRDVVLLGTRPIASQEDVAAARLQAMLSRRSFLLTDVSRAPLGEEASEAYVHLSDRTFVNSRLIREGLLGADADVEHPHRDKFMKESSAAE